MSSVLDLIGETPLVEVTRLDTGPCRLFLKLECNNPSGSIKDRPARTMIEAWAALGPRHDSIDGRGGELALVEPWTWTSHRRPRLMPRPEAVVKLSRVATRSPATSANR